MDKFMERWLELEGDWCPGLKGRWEEAKLDKDYVTRYGGSTC